MVFQYLRAMFRNAKRPPSASEEPATIFANDIYRASAACANIIIRDNTDIDERFRLPLTSIFLHGFLHLIDRQLFGVLPTRRGEVMNGLALRCCTNLIHEFAGPRITKEEREQLLDTAIEKFNEVSIFYGACKKLTADADEGTKNTFFWEFGKRFAACVDRPMDIAYIDFGSKLLVNVLGDLNVAGRLQSLS